MQFRQTPKSNFILSYDTLMRWYSNCVVWHKKDKREGLIVDVQNDNQDFAVFWIDNPNNIDFIRITNSSLVFKRPQLKPIDHDMFSFFTSFRNQGGQGIYKRGFNSQEYTVYNPIESDLNNLKVNAYVELREKPLVLFNKLRLFKLDPNMIEKVFDKERIMGVVGDKSILAWTNNNKYPLLFSGEQGEYIKVCRTKKDVVELVND